MALEAAAPAWRQRQPRLALEAAAPAWRLGSSLQLGRVQSNGAWARRTILLFKGVKQPIECSSRATAWRWRQQPRLGVSGSRGWCWRQQPRLDVLALLCSWVAYYQTEPGPGEQSCCSKASSSRSNVAAEPQLGSSVSPVCRETFFVCFFLLFLCWF